MSLDGSTIVMSPSSVSRNPTFSIPPHLTGEDDYNLDTTGYCLLSLDGGGVRGLSTLYILQSVMGRLNYMRNKSRLRPLEPFQIFDLIGGTSTGGLIAIMLGRLQMPVEKCIAAYTGLMKSVFASKQKRSMVKVLRGVQPRFSADALEAAIKKVIRDAGHAPDEPLYDGQEPQCKVFVCTKFQMTNTSTRLRNYRLPSGNDHGPTILQAALATSAAPTYFPDVKIAGMKFVDGAIGANNPVFDVVAEASDLWCEDTGRIQPLVKCFLSIGTGHPGIRSVSDKGYRHLIETLQKQATETEDTNRMFHSQWREQFDKGRCFRFTVEHGLEDVGLAEWEESDVLQSATTSYLEEWKTRVVVKTCVENLRLKKYQANPEADKKFKERMFSGPEQRVQPTISRATSSEISEIIRTGNESLKIPYARRTRNDLLNAGHYFDQALKSLQGNPSVSSPKDVARVCQKLLETELALSMKMPSGNHHERRQHADRALEYGEAALDNAVKINNQIMVVQIQFLLAALNIWRVNIQAKASGIEPRLAPGRDFALAKIQTILREIHTIESLDYAGYEEQARYYEKWLNR